MSGRSAHSRSTGVSTDGPSMRGHWRDLLAKFLHRLADGVGVGAGRAHDQPVEAEVLQPFHFVEAVAPGTPDACGELDGVGISPGIDRVPAPMAISKVCLIAWYSTQLRVLVKV